MLDTSIISFLKQYSKVGFNLVPLKEKDKIPVIKWKPLIKTPLTIDELRIIYSKNPKLNIGVMCGVSSGGLVVIDVDHQIPEELAFLIAENPTVTIQTSRGRHYYYRSKEKLKNLNFDWGEFRANDVYVMVPPSIHPDGTRYEFLGGCRFDEISSLPKTLKTFLLKSDVGVKKSVKPVKNESCPRNELNNIYSRTDLTGYFKKPQVAYKIMVLCDREVDKLGQHFNCVLPGTFHNDKNPSAALWRGSNGIITYHDFHEDKFWLLPEVYAAVKTKALDDEGNPIHLSNGEMAIWGLRALHEIGEIQPVKIAAKALPKGVSKSVTKLYDGFIYLLELRELYIAGQAGTPFSWSFASGWCDLKRTTVRNSLNWLLMNSFIEKTKECVKHGKQSPTLYKLK